MKNLRYILICAVIMMSGKLSAQVFMDIPSAPKKEKVSSIKPLKVGDVVPDIKLPRIFNDKKGSASLSDYKNRLVILDFGSTTCSGCVAALPHMETLQKEFGDKIKLFWVTNEDEQRVAGFWKVNKNTVNNTLPVVVGRNQLWDYFKNWAWPHHAWIYKGKVIAITSAEYADALNIKKVLNGEAVSFPVKDDFAVAFDAMKQPIFPVDSNQAHPSSVISYAAISDYRDDASGSANFGANSAGRGIVRNKDNKTVRAFLVNEPLFFAYFTNYMAIIPAGTLVKPDVSVNYPTTDNQTIWEVKDKNRYTYISKEKSGYNLDWLRLNAICFESVQPDTGQTDVQVYASMNKDLNRLLGLNVRWEKRKEKVLVLVANGTAGLIEWKKGSQNSTRVSSIANDINYGGADNPYTFNETKMAAHLAVPVKITDWTDVNGIRKLIKPYGLELKEEERLVDKFVFSEVNGGKLVRN